MFTMERTEKALGEIKRLKGSRKLERIFKSVIPLLRYSQQVGLCSQIPLNPFLIHQFSSKFLASYHSTLQTISFKILLLLAVDLSRLSFLPPLILIDKLSKRSTKDF